MLKIETTQHVLGILEKSKQCAIDLNQKSVSEDIFFYIFMSNLSSTMLRAFSHININPEDLWNEASKYLKEGRSEVREASFSKSVQRILDLAEELTTGTFQEEYLSPEILFLAFFSETHLPKALLSFFKIEEKSLFLENIFLGNLLKVVSYYIKDRQDALESFEQIEEKNETRTNNDWISMFEENAVLSKFAKNLNLAASRGEFEKIVDFDNKIDEIATILCRKKKPNAILVGPAGTGKTSLVQGLALKIVNGEAPDLLSNKVIYSVNLSSMVAGTQYRGQFEQRLEEFIQEAKKYSNLILFIDEIHTLVGAGGGSSSSLEASNILKPELSSGAISCIGATTTNEYTHSIKKDAALDRRFEKVVIREPSKFKMEEILPEILNYYEEFHGVKYSEEFVGSLIDFCERFLPNRRYPDKAIDIIDHCGAQAKVKFWEMDEEIKKFQKTIINKLEEGVTVEEVDVDFLNKKIEEWENKLTTSNAEVGLIHLKEFFEAKGSPLNKNSIIDSLFKEVKDGIISNKKEINSLEVCFRRAAFGLSKKYCQCSPDSYVISGEPSTGKTLLCSIIQNSLERSGANVIFYNGTELSDGYAPYKIVSPNQNNTSLAEKILIHPNSIIIIDDFDKVHSSCNSLISQILKEGKLQMPNGEIADFSNSKIILTTGIGKNSIMGFNAEISKGDPLLNKEISSLVSSKTSLSPLTKRGLRRVLYLKMKNIQKTSKLQGVNIEIKFDFLKDFVDKNYEKGFSVKVLNEAFEEKVMPDILKKILEKR